MSILKTVTSKGNNKLVIPYAGKMFMTNISKDNKALCFLINKGYFECPDLQSVFTILDEASESGDTIAVGDVEKIRLSSTGLVVYRQRVFFKNLHKLLQVMNSVGVRFELAQDFKISINNVLHIRDELPNLERYAIMFGQSIDEWLTSCCVIQLNYLLLYNNLYSSLARYSNSVLTRKWGYLQRAPFLASSVAENVDDANLFLDLNITDTRLYTSVDPDAALYLSCGYTTKHVLEDKKAGVLG